MVWSGSCPSPPDSLLYRPMLVVGARLPMEMVQPEALRSQVIVRALDACSRLQDRSDGPLEVPCTLSHCVGVMSDPAAKSSSNQQLVIPELRKIS